MHRLALILMTSAGCSLIYNPNGLPDPVIDAPDSPEAPPPVDANPANLEIDAVTQGPLLEGQGTGGSVPAVLYVSGHDIIQGATVKVEPDPANADVVIEVLTTVVASDGLGITAVVKAQLSPLTEAQGPVPLKITVTQPAPDDSVSKTTAWSFKPLDTLTMAGSNAGTIDPPEDKLYSDATLDTALPFKFTGGNQRVIVRAVTSIVVTNGGTLDASATGRTAGAGGCDGGGAGTNGLCHGAGDGSASGGGGGAGFRLAGSPGMNGGAQGSTSGSPEIADYSPVDENLENRGAGGGGGGAGGVLNGGVGGGGGGSIELTAGGDLTLTDITLQADGANGANSATSSGGGGGAGGVVLLRAGGVYSAPAAISVAAGAQGTGTVFDGGAGSVGRIRIDTTSTVTVPSGAYVGPAITPPADVVNLVVRTATPALSVHGTTNDTFTIITKHSDATNTTQAVAAFNGTSVIPTLKVGLNQICFVLNNGSIAKPEGVNCIDMVFLP